ncbi:MAG: hypothetical protein F8N37_13100 [Telmatospirillum sp.]|nr:hypothetical protein [Telmatospirillum sp.]
MALALSFRCPLAGGLHARPASRLLALCASLDADIEWRNLRTGRAADIRSPLALLSTDTLFDDPCEIVVGGADAVAARDRISRFLASEAVGATSDPDPRRPAGPQPSPGLPPMVEDAGLWGLCGRPAAAGLAYGRLRSLPPAFSSAEPPAGVVPVDSGPAGQAPDFDRVVAEARRRLDADDDGATGVARDILGVRRDLLSDDGLLTALRRALTEDGGAAGAIGHVFETYRRDLAGMRNELVRDREHDLRDLHRLLLDVVCPRRGGGGAGGHRGRPVIFAADVTPGEVLVLARTGIAALLLGRAGATSHSVVLARALGIPVITGCDCAALAARDGLPVVVDADQGVVIDATHGAARRYRFLEGAVRSEQRLAAPFAASDGPVMFPAVAANLVLPSLPEDERAALAETSAAFRNGAGAIGLVRTESMLLAAGSLPDEDRQTALYTGVVAAAAGRPVTFRTFDIGGDKIPASLPRAPEANPVLGLRGVAFYRRHEQILRTQLRALLRAGEAGPIAIMIPMVRDPSDMVWVRRVLEEERKTLAERGIAAPGPCPLGMMLEVPSAVLMAAHFCPVADFFSIGTNDLAQYLLAIDRGHPLLAADLKGPHPALLRLLDQAVREIRRQGRPVSMCGDLASDSAVLPLMAGLGLDAISVDPAALADIRAQLASLDRDRCRGLLEKALSCPDAGAVRALLATVPVRRRRPVVATDCVSLDCDWRTRAEVIKGMAGRLWLAGRVGGRHDLEALLWRRERHYSTGLGFGIAVPHARSPLVLHSTISIARLRRPVDWGAIDGAPVDIVIMLTAGMTAPEDDHLKLFSRLARNLVDAGFRGRLRACRDRQTILELIGQALAGPEPQGVS